MYWQIFWLVVSYVISAALAPRPPQPRAALLSDFQLPVAQDGAPIGEAFGDVWISGSNVAWFGDMSTTPIRRSGGKK